MMPRLTIYKEDGAAEIVSTTIDQLAGGAPYVYVVVPVNGDDYLHARVSHATNGTGIYHFSAGRRIFSDNQPPDCSVASASPDRLWPPRHQYAKVAVAGVTDPDGDPVTITITRIAQDEPLDSYGDGHTCPDGDGVGTDMALVRAERARSRRNSKDGRVYHISFTADDGRGGTCTGTVNVCVPPNRHPGATCVDQGPLVDSTGPCD